MDRLEQPIVRCMTTEVVSIAGGASLRAAARELAEHGIGLLVIVEDDHVVGVLSERDLVRAVADGRDLDMVHVVDRGSGEVVTVDRAASLADALELMLTHDVRHLVATDGSHRPVGVLSMRDVMTELAVR